MVGDEVTHGGVELAGAGAGQGNGERGIGGDWIQRMDRIEAVLGQSEIGRVAKRFGLDELRGDGTITDIIKLYQ